MKALVLAAAKSPKLEPFSSTRPKSMIFLGGEHILETTLKRIKEAGINEVILVVGHQREMIQEAFHYGKKLELKIDYLIQEEEQGIGKAVLLAEEKLKQEEHFLLVYGDTLMSGNQFLHLSNHFQTAPDGNLAAITHPVLEGGYGNIYLGHDMKINRFIEKPEGGRLSNYIFGGSFILERGIFERLHQNQGDMVALWHSLISEGKLAASLWEDEWIDLSRPWHILRANRMILSGWETSIIPRSCKIDSGVHIDGVVHMGENVHVCSGTTIVGPCYIGDNSFIGHSSLLRDHCSIGPNSSIGYGTEIKNSVIFGEAKIGRLSFLGDSVIGERVLMGSGTITINYLPEQKNLSSLGKDKVAIPTGLPKVGSFVGDNSHIGAGNILAPGTLIKADSFFEDRFNIQSNL